MEQPKKQLLTVSVDTETVKAVQRLAAAECEGNLSQATRRLIKAGAYVLEFLPAQANDRLKEASR